MIAALKKLWVAVFKQPEYFTDGGIKMHVSPTGKVSVDPNDVVKSQAFQAQLKAVARLRQRSER